MEWKRVEPTEVTKIGWRTIVTKSFVLPNGKRASFDTFNTEGTHNAGVIAITSDKRAVIVRQWRPGPERFMDEIPGGGVEPDETDYQAAALRELKEETGYVPGKIITLGSVYKDAYNNSTWHYFLAEDCALSPEGASHDEHEFIEVRLISIEELIENSMSGRMTDPEAILLAYEKLKDIGRK